MSSPDLIQSYKYTSNLITENIHQQKSYTIYLTTYVFADYAEVYAVKLSEAKEQNFDCAAKFFDC